MRVRDLPTEDSLESGCKPEPLTHRPASGGVGTHLPSPEGIRVRRHSEWPEAQMDRQYSGKRQGAHEPLSLEKGEVSRSPRGGS